MNRFIRRRAIRLDNDQPQVVEYLEGRPLDRLAAGPQEARAMPSDWRGLGRFTNIVWVMWLLLALGTLGYFVSLGIQILRHG